MRTDSLIAQLVERRTVNPQVPGSSPGWRAKYQKAHSIKVGFFFAQIFDLQCYVESGTTCIALDQILNYSTRSLIFTTTDHEK